MAVGREARRLDASRARSHEDRPTDDLQAIHADQGWALIKSRCRMVWLAAYERLRLERTCIDLAAVEAVDRGVAP